jgi:hypothetical protein
MDSAQARNRVFSVAYNLAFLKIRATALVYFLKLSQHILSSEKH